jgi:hypothetical protein
MDLSADSPFETIESAQKFLELLSETVVEAKRDLSADVQREFVRGTSRRLDALRIALYNLEKLDVHMRQSNRILNDLRMVRRLLFQERSAGGAQDARENSAASASQIVHETPRTEKTLAA